MSDSGGEVPTKFFHDLRNMLTVISAQCELLDDEVCAPANKRLSMISKAVRRIEEMLAEQSTPVGGPTREAGLSVAVSVAQH